MLAAVNHMALSDASWGQSHGINNLLLLTSSSLNTLSSHIYFSNQKKRIFIWHIWVYLLHLLLCQEGNKQFEECKLWIDRWVFFQIMGETAERGVLYVFCNHMAQCIYQFYSINSSCTSFYFLWSTLQGLLFWHILFSCSCTQYSIALSYMSWVLILMPKLGLHWCSELRCQGSRLKLIVLMLTTSASHHAFSSYGKSCNSFASVCMKLSY